MKGVNSQDPKSVADWIRPTVKGLGFELWGIEYSRQRQDFLVRIYIDKPGGIVVDDCAQTSEQLSLLFDANDVFVQAYLLEVSSPGLDRIFFNAEQLQAYLNKTLKITFKHLIEGRRRLTAELQEVDGQHITVNNNGSVFEFDFDDADRIRLGWTL